MIDEKQGRALVKQAVKLAIRAVDPAKLVRRCVRKGRHKLHVCGHPNSLRNFDRIVVLGAGKASGAMAQELAKIIRIDAGAVAVPRGTARKFRARNVEFIEAGHPHPDAGSLRAARKIMQLARSCNKRDLVICLFSGGGSALMSYPAAGITLVQKAALSNALMKAGADIGELNTVRRHLSRIKGGLLAKALDGAYHAHSLLISDVVGNELASIASGPTVADPTTFADAVRVLKKYKLWQGPARKIIEQGMAGLREETLKHQPSDVHNYIIGSNKSAIIAVCRYLHSKGVRIHAMPDITGEAKVVGARLAKLAAGGTSFCAGGETIVKVKGKGRGGRNQELTLAAAMALDGRRAIIASVGTDGIDGQSRAAGAIASGSTIARAKKLGMDARKFLAHNDSNSFFRRLGDEIITGPTGTNAHDVMIGLALKGRRRKP